jgi:hypothetical protein
MDLILLNIQFFNNFQINMIKFTPRLRINKIKPFFTLYYYVLNVKAQPERSDF